MFGLFAKVLDKVLQMDLTDMFTFSNVSDTTDIILKMFGG